MTRAHTHGADRAEIDELLARFGRNLRRIRRARGYSQIDLAALAYLRPSQVSALERGRRTPDLIVLRLLADALDAPIALLAEGLDPPIRAAGRALLLARIAERPGLSAAALRSEMPELPHAYVDLLLRRLLATGEIERADHGWRLARGPVAEERSSANEVSEHREEVELTNREREVLEIICEGGAHSDIAARLQISHETARTHTANLRRKLGAQRTRALRTSHAVGP